MVRCRDQEAAVPITNDICATANNRFDVAIKNALTSAGGTGFNFPACSAPEFESGTNYVAGSKVSYNGCVVRLLKKFITKSIVNQLHLAGKLTKYHFTNVSPTKLMPFSRRNSSLRQHPITVRTGNGVRVSVVQESGRSLFLTIPLVSACAGDSAPPISSSSTKTTTTSTSSTVPNNPPTPTQGGSCAGVPAWTASQAYTGGQRVVYKYVLRNCS